MAKVGPYLWTRRSRVFNSGFLAWSRDGRRVAAVWSPAYAASSIWIVDPSGHEPLQKLSALPITVHRRGITWTPDGSGVHFPFDYALELARKFCTAEPSTVLVGVETTERGWSRKAATPGEEYIVTFLNDYRASWALLRHLAGYDAALASREAEIQRLERLVWDALYALQKAGLDSEAARLRRAINKH